MPWFDRVPFKTRSVVKRESPLQSITIFITLYSSAVLIIISTFMVSMNMCFHAVFYKVVKSRTFNTIISKYMHDVFEA